MSEQTDATEDRRDDEELAEPEQEDADDGPQPSANALPGESD